MLGIVTCDAAVEPGVWRDMLRRACEASFNAVSGWYSGVGMRCVHMERTCAA
jgi:hypothetical protein